MINGHVNLTSQVQNDTLILVDYTTRKYRGLYEKNNDYITYSNISNNFIF